MEHRLKLTDLDETFRHPGIMLILHVLKKNWLFVKCFFSVK